MTGTPLVREMIKQAIEELGGSATYAQMRDAILARYPDVNTSTINAQIISCTVNAPSRVNYHAGGRVRSNIDTRYDILFSDYRGHVVLYEPEKHGLWEIVKQPAGYLEVVKAGEGSTDTLAKIDDGGEGQQTDPAQANVPFQPRAAPARLLGREHRIP